MIDILLKIDSNLFYFINSKLSNPIFDFIFVPIHKPQKHWFLIILLLSLLGWYLYTNFNKSIKHTKKAILVIIFLIIGIIITDQIGRTIKNLEIRSRPYMTEKIIKIPNKIDIKKDKYDNYKENDMAKKSFPSNHAANICFISFFLSYIYYNRKKYFIMLAILVSISRVYIGVHYPFDIIVGGLIGIIVGYLVIKIINKLELNLARYHQEA